MPAAAQTACALCVPWWLMRSRLERRDAGGGGHFVVELADEVLAAGDAAAGHAAGEYLGHGREVGGDADSSLQAAGRDAETAHDFVEYQRGGVLLRDLAQLAQHGVRGRHGTGAGAERLDQHGGDVVACGQQVLHGGHVVDRHEDDAGRDFAQHAGRGRAVEVVLGAERDVVVPAVEVALETDDLFLAARGARDSQREVRCLSAGRREAHALGGRHHLADELRPLDLKLGAGGKVHALLQLRLRGGDDLRVLVAEQQRAVAAVVVDVFVAVEIPFAGAERVVAVDAVGPQPAGVVDDAARQHLYGLAVALRGALSAAAIRVHDAGFDDGFIGHGAGLCSSRCGCAGAYRQSPRLGQRAPGEIRMMTDTS